jgi:peptidyl-prolyl cis-trans isomerase SurA
MILYQKLLSMMRSKTRFLVFCLALTSLLLHAETVDRIVAVVNDDVVMESELHRQVQRITAELTQQNTNLPPPEVLKRQVLERLILMKIQLQLANQNNLHVDDEILNRTISNIAAENRVSLERFREIIEQGGYNFSQFREDIRDEILIARLRQYQIDNLIHVSEKEVDNYLATQAQQGNSDTEYRLAYILIATPEAASPEQIAAARQKAEKILKRLRAGEDFNQMAVAVSDDSQALEGGDLGWRRLTELPAAFTEAVISLQAGKISDLIRSPSGFHIIKLLDKRSGEAQVIRQTQARHILIKPNEVVSAAEAQRRLQQLKHRIEAGEDFAELARSHSEDKGTAAKGGDLGWVSPGELMPKFEEIMNSLAQGEVSEPFETQFGWHIVQVLDHRDQENNDEILRAQAREAIRKRKTEEEYQAWLRRLRDESYVEYRP